MFQLSRSSFLIRTILLWIYIYIYTIDHIIVRIIHLNEGIVLFLWLLCNSFALRWWSVGVTQHSMMIFCMSGNCYYTVSFSLWSFSNWESIQWKLFYFVCVAVHRFSLMGVYHCLIQIKSVFTFWTKLGSLHFHLNENIVD